MKAEHCYTPTTINCKELSAWALKEASSSERKNDYSNIWLYDGIFLDHETAYNYCPELKLINNVVEIEHFQVFRMKSGDYYRLHKDRTRGVAMNILLSSVDSVCLFMHPNIPTSAIKLDYQPNIVYLFNTQAPHAVFNFSGSRYLMSIHFKRDMRSLSYNLLRDIVSDLNLV